jgi:hypothetical protein
MWKADVIDAVDIADGISVARQDYRGHGLLLLQLLNLRRELPDLFLKFQFLGPRSRAGTEEQNSSQQGDCNQTGFCPMAEASRLFQSDFIDFFVHGKLLCASYAFLDGLSVKAAGGEGNLVRCRRNRTLLSCRSERLFSYGTKGYGPPIRQGRSREKSLANS